MQPSLDLAVLEQLRNAGIDIARDAAQKIMTVYGGEVTATQKADDSPLTLADLLSHSAIVASLNKLTPNVPILSEEGATIPWDIRSKWNRYWLIDPLDGTKEFLARNGEFTVNIALVIDHQPVLGIVYVPATMTCYTGVVGGGAAKCVGHSPASQIVVQSPAADPLRVVASRSHREASLDALLADLGTHELLSRGSSLKLCLVAEGAADLYPRLGPTCEWDTAAAQAVVVAAGGHVVALDGLPIRYNTKSSLLNPSFLVYGDGDRDWAGLARQRLPSI